MKENHPKKKGKAAGHTKTDERSRSAGTPRSAENRKSAKSKKKKKSKAWKIVRRLFSILFSTILSIVLICIITTTIVGTAVTVYVLDFMDEASTITLEEMELAYNTNIYGYNEDGELVTLYQVTNEVQRIPVEIEDIPQHVLDAFVYTEDARFYTHDGVDYKNTIAACVNLVLHFWDTDRGGSTITQQLIKNVTGDDDPSPSRKIREIFRAMTLEKNYSKDEIMETYLNYIGFGGAANGIEMASIKYFGKNVGDLTVAEAAVLAAIPQSPETINPFASYIDDETGEVVQSGRKRNRDRQEYVLWQMYEHGALSYDDYQEAMNEHLIFADTEEYKKLHPEDDIKEYDPNAAETSWVIDAAIYEVRDYLMEANDISAKEAIHRINTGGYQIYTTVDPKMQAYVEEKYMELDNLIDTRRSARYNEDTNGDGEIDEYDDPVYPQATFIAMNYEGEILACVGAIGEKQGALITNYATSEPRQPGSTIKPVAGYGYGIYSGEFQWGTKIKDYGIEVDGELWPHNYSMSNEVTNYSGNDLNMYYGLMKSLNTISARLVDALTPEAVFKFATDNMGLDLVDLTPEGYTDMALSPLSVGALTYGVTLENMVNAYIPYGNGGMMYDAHIVSRVEQGNHELVYENKGNPYEAVDEQTAYIMNRMMKHVVSSNGTAGAAVLKNKEVVGKTGTTQDWNDLWFIGLTEDFVSGVWIGYVQREKLDTSISSAKMWYNAIGEYANSIDSDAEYPVPEEGIIEAAMCSDTGMIATKNCPKGEIGYWKEEDAPYCNGKHYTEKATGDPDATYSRKPTETSATTSANGEGGSSYTTSSNNEWTPSTEAPTAPPVVATDPPEPVVPDPPAPIEPAPVPDGGGNDGGGDAGGDA